MTWGTGTAGLLVTGEPQGIPVEHATLHEGGVQGTGHPTGLQPENPGGNVTPAENREKCWLLIDANSLPSTGCDALSFQSKLFISSSL